MKISNANNLTPGYAGLSIRTKGSQALRFLKTTRNLLMRFRSSLNRDRLPSGHLPPRSPKNWHPTFGSRFRTPD